MKEPISEDMPYELGYDCWYVTAYPKKPYVSGEGIDGKYRGAAIALAKQFTESGLMPDCDYVEFSSKHSGPVLRWYPQTNRWTWDYWEISGYSASTHIVGEWADPAPSLADELQAVFDDDDGGMFAIGMLVVKNHDAILAALRAVEAVRASKAADEFCFRVCDPEDPRGWHAPECRAYRDGVEAVQALLEGMK